jgi:GSH-dependent disulfide-bond oxidoreductase
MIRFYFNGSPNPEKVALFLEEAELAYDPVPVDVRKGEQFDPELLALNPNGKVPVIVDDGVPVFDSNAILLYLAEKTGLFLPAGDPAARAELLSWLMFAASGLGPYCGQAVHFTYFAPETRYARERYRFEAERHFQVLDRRLAERRYMLGETYSIVDMGVWGWSRFVPFILGDEGWGRLPNLRRLTVEISARPAAIRASELRRRYVFKSEMDDEARRHMFRHLAAARH